MKTPVLKKAIVTAIEKSSHVGEEALAHAIAWAAPILDRYGLVEWSWEFISQMQDGRSIFCALWGETERDGDGNWWNSPGLAQYLPPHLWEKVLGLAQGMDDEYWRSIIIRWAAPFLPSDLIPLALEVLWGIQEESYKVDALSHLAPRLSPELLAEAFDHIKGLRSDEARGWGLKYLAPYLPAASLGDILKMIEGLKISEPFRMFLLSEIASCAG